MQKDLILLGIWVKRLAKRSHTFIYILCQENQEIRASCNMNPEYSCIVLEAGPFLLQKNSNRQQNLSRKIGVRPDKIGVRPDIRTLDSKFLNKYLSLKLVQKNKLYEMSECQA